MAHHVLVFDDQVDVSLVFDIECYAIPGQERSVVPEVKLAQLVDVLAHHPEARGQRAVHEALDLRQPAARRRLLEFHFSQVVLLKLEVGLVLHTLIISLAQAQHLVPFALDEARVLTFDQLNLLLVKILLFLLQMLLIHLKDMEWLIARPLVHNLEIVKVGR